MVPQISWCWSNGYAPHWKISIWCGKEKARSSSSIHTGTQLVMLNVTKYSLDLISYILSYSIFRFQFKFSSWIMAIVTICIGAIFGLLASFKVGRYLLETFPGILSLGNVTKAGPSKETAESSFFKMTLRVCKIISHSIFALLLS